ncbi:PRD domain-containing protein [Enterococcus faecalis]|uniref:PRD domain-containing protein n=1 Tax=Enterococcus faecalis TaxID=1351 RepID=UPI00313F101B
MIVVKTLNNNIVLVQDQMGNEKVLFGTGIGFKKRQGDSIDESLISKIFTPNAEEQTDHKIDNFQPEILSVSARIIESGELILNQKFGTGLLFSLADHLTFSIYSIQENDNPIKWEVPHLYYKEYQIGKKALEIVQNEMGVTLLPEEASFIALHFVNAQIDQPNMVDTLQITEVIKKIVKSVQTIFDTILDKTTADYSRFITHIRYFIIRQKNSQESLKMDKQIRELIQERYMKSYACGLIIKEMLERDYQWKISEDELIYLVIHIERITTK